MKTAASYDSPRDQIGDRVSEIASEHGWVNPLDMPYEDFLKASDLWLRLYRARDWIHHFRAATRTERPNKVSMHRMNTFTDAYNLARLRGKL